MRNELCALLEEPCAKEGSLDSKQLKALDEAITFFYSFCNEHREEDSTPWLAMCILRLFHARSSGDIWLDSLPEGTTWTVDRPPFLHHLVVIILRTAIKMDKQYYGFQVDNLASEFCPDYLRSLETKVLETVDWRLFFTTPIDFLREHQRDFDVSDHEFKVVKLMLIYCAKSDELCRSCRSGSLVVACLSFLRRIGDDLVDGVERILLVASVTHQSFQKSVALDEIDHALQFILNDPQTERFMVPPGARRVARSPSTVQVKRVKLRMKRPPIQPAPDTEDENSHFPDSECITPHEGLSARRRFRPRDSS
jgi:hypothetical protein